MKHNYSLSCWYLDRNVSFNLSGFGLGFLTCAFWWFCRRVQTLWQDVLNTFCFLNTEKLRDVEAFRRCFSMNLRAACVSSTRDSQKGEAGVAVGQALTWILSWYESRDPSWVINTVGLLWTWNRNHSEWCIKRLGCGKGSRAVVMKRTEESDLPPSDLLF